MPPPGVTPFAANAPSHEKDFVITVSVCFALTVPAVAIRVFTKAYILRRMESEDYALILSLLGYTALTAFALKVYDFFQGKHQWDVTIANVMHTFQTLNYAQIIYVFPIFFAKYALLRQIGRIFTHQRSKSSINYIAWFLILANLILYVVVFFIFLFGCVPREKMWMPHVPGKCLSTAAALIATAAVNIVSDVAILVLPLVGIWGLKMEGRKKVGVAGIFVTGALAVVVGILRIYYTVRFNRTADKTWALIPLSLFGIAEVATLILCCCFITFPRFFSWLASGGDKNRSLWSSSAVKSGAGSKGKGLSRFRSLGTGTGVRSERAPGNGSPEILESGGIERRTDIVVVREDGV